MIQAIVFLPLIGAVLAGLIAVFGAHARNPSGDMVEHHSDALARSVMACPRPLAAMPQSFMSRTTSR